MNIWRQTFYVIIFVFVSSPATYAEIPAKPSSPTLVNDYANMLSAPFAQSLERELTTYERATSTQIAVVTVETLDEYDIAHYAVELGQSWGIGSKKDNGVLILIAKQERRINISTGYGVEGALTDIVSKRIIDEYMTPRFKQGNFDEGVAAGIQLIGQALKGEFTNDTAVAKSRKPKLGGRYMIVVALIFFVMLFARGFSAKRRNRTGNLRGGGGFLTGMLLGGMLGRGGGFGGGGFGGGGFGGGGFGGFGGGGFGGGGASGGW